MTTAADASARKVFAVAVGQNPANQLVTGINVETDRRFGMVGVLCPTGNAIVADAVDVAAQLPGSFVGRDQAGAQRDPLPNRFHLIAVFQTRAQYCAMPATASG